MKNRDRILRIGRALLCVVVSVGLVGTLFPTAQATTTAGRTDALVNGGQVARDASSAIPVVGFNMTSTGGEDLQTVAVEFVDVSGWDPGDDEDLRRLDVDAGKSGVGLYRDDGGVDDRLDAGDTPIVLDDIGWAGDRVDMDLSVTGEPVPTAVAGLYQWFVVIRTADVTNALDEEDAFRVLMGADSIVATSGVGTVSQPASDVLSEALTIRLSRGVNMIGGDEWIGPERVAVNSMAIHGFRVVDGGVSTNYGIDDRMVEVRVRLVEEDGILTSADLQPLDPDGNVSGLGLYVDDGSTDDVWDVSDTPVVLADIAPPTFSFGGATFTLTPQAPGLALPQAPGGALDFFFVVRTRDIVTGDEFRLQVRDRAVRINGLLAGQGGSVDAGLQTPLDREVLTLPSGVVRGDSTPPRMRDEGWREDSAFLFSRGLELYFGNFMTSPQAAFAEGEARDDESGLALARFSSEAGLAASPSDDPLAGSDTWEAYSGPYLLNATSTDASSPAVVTIFDAVGNNVSSLDTDMAYAYVQVTSPVLILPNPGWTAPGGTPTWVDGNGMLWFGRQMAGTVTVDLTVDLVALSGAALRNATASVEPSLAGGPQPASVTYAPVLDDDTWTVSYVVDAASNGSASPAALWAEDNLGNGGAASFAYALDALGPSVAFLSPAPFDTLRGEVTVRASVEDVETDVQGVHLAVDASGALQAMYFDGEEYFLVLNTALFADGPHRLLLQAEDVVGNVRTVGVDVAFDNAVDGEPPAIVVTSPANDAYLSGTIAINATATDAFLVAFEYAVDGGSWRPVGEALDTTALVDGPHLLTLRAVDAGGLTTAVELRVRVDNADPEVILIGPPEGSSLSGLVVVQVFAQDTSGIAEVILEMEGQAVPMAYNRQTGHYEHAFDSTLLPDGEVSVTVTARDESGRTAELPATLRLANAIPPGTLALQILQENALLLLLVVLVVLFAAGIRALRRGGEWVG